MRWLVAALFFAFSMPAMAGVEEGEALYNRGDVQGALAEFRALAESGDALAQSWVGYIYEVEFGDDVAALEWYRRSAEGFESYAQNKLGLFYRDGRGGLVADIEAAASWFRRAADQGLSDGQYNLGDLLEYDYGGDANLTEAANLYRLAAEQGLPEAQAAFASLLRRGEGVAQDYAAAASWAQAAADQGNAQGQNELGLLYENGNGVGQDPAEAFRLYRLAADQDYTAAFENLGYLYEYGLGVDADVAEAARLYRVAADRGFRYAQYRMGVFFRDGIGGLGPSEVDAESWLRQAAENDWYAAHYDLALLLQARESPEAVDWFRRAADNGHVDAQLALGRAFEAGHGVAADPAKAVRWYQAAADQGSGAAASELGDAYYFGSGVAQDYAVAADWFTTAAEGGDAYGQFSLGYAYEHGQGIGPDLDEALLWYRLSSMQGEGLAMTALADHYLTGDGVAADGFRAYMWYEIAAMQGVYGAMVVLGDMYRDGEVVDADPALSFFYYLLAQASGDQAIRDRAYEGARGIEPRLSGEDRSVAETMVAMFQPRGVAGPDSLSLLDPMTARASEFQQMLTDLGYYTGAVDGVLGAETEAAMRAFATDYGVPNDGALTPLLFVAAGEVLIATGAGSSTSQGTTSTTSTSGEPVLVATGSGFYVDDAGHLLTNHHVIEGCTELRLSGRGPAQVQAIDAESDLALLTAAPAGAAALTFRDGTGIRPGDSIVVVGYPLQGTLASEMIVTAGIVNALAGLGNDRRFVQIQAPVHGGNSGGPLLDASGNVVGVIVSKLDVAFVEATNELPQNINFAVSGWTARAFLDANGVRYGSRPSDAAMQVADIADRARPATVMIECWQ
jgi:TPR repeat protein/S1-C subfamily serine protease